MAIARDEPLPHGQRLPLIAIRHANLLQAAMQRRGGLDMVDQSFESGSQRRVGWACLAALPATRAVIAHRCFNIFAKRRRQGALKAGLGPQLSERRPAAVIKRPRLCLALRPGRT